MFDARSIGEKVYRIRKTELHKTQEQFADMIDMSKETVNNIERGAVIPRTSTLVKLAKATNKTIDFFLSEEE